MRDLSELLDRALQGRTRGYAAEPVDAALATVLDRVHHRRRVRTVVRSALAVPLVAALATAGWWVTGDRSAPPPPADTPIPTVAPTVPSTPTPSPEPDESEGLGAPVLRPGFPPYHELRDGTLEEAGPGWVLATVVPRTVDVGASEHDVEGLFLIRPDGTRFLLHWLPTGLEVDETAAVWTQHDVVSFDAAAGTAVLQVREHGETYAGEFVDVEGSVLDAAGPVVRMDLATGATQPLFEPVERADHRSGVVGDDWLWQPHPEGETPVLVLQGDDDARTIDTTHVTAGAQVPISPDERWALTGWGVREIEVVDLTAGRSHGVVVPDEELGWCGDGRTWWDADTAAVVCRADDGSGRVVLATLDVHDLEAGLTVVRDLTSDAPHWGAGAHVAAGTLALPVSSQEGTAYCHDGVRLVDGEGSSELMVGALPAGIHRIEVSGGTVYVRSEPCFADGEARRPTYLVAQHPTAAAAVELVGAPAPGAEGTAWATTLSFAVAE